MWTVDTGNGVFQGNTLKEILIRMAKYYEDSFAPEITRIWHYINVEIFVSKSGCDEFGSALFDLIDRKSN